MSPTSKTVKSKKPVKRSSNVGEGKALVRELQKSLIQELQKKGTAIRAEDFIMVHMVFNGDETKGWVHTHNMWDLFGLPDLEIRGVYPIFLMADAGRILNHIAQYMIDSKSGVDNAKPVSIGETMSLGFNRVVRFSSPGPAGLHENHFKNPRWLVEEVPMKCEACERGEEHVH